MNISATSLSDVNGLLDEAFGDADKNVVHFKIVETILYVIANHLKLLDRQIDFIMKPFMNLDTPSEISIAEVKIHAEVKKPKKKAKKGDDKKMLNEYIKQKQAEGKKQKAGKGTTDDSEDTDKQRTKSKPDSSDISKEDIGRSRGVKKKEFSSDEDITTKRKDDAYSDKSSGAKDKKRAQSRKDIMEKLWCFEENREKQLRVIDQRDDSYDDIGKSPQPMASMSETEIVREKLLVVDKYPGGTGKPSSTGRARDKNPPTLGIVTREQFEPLKKTVKDIQRNYYASLADSPDFPLNAKLLEELSKGASLSDAIAALQLSARIEAAENNIKDLIKLMKRVPGMDKKTKGVIGGDEISSDEFERPERAKDKSKDKERARKDKDKTKTDQDIDIDSRGTHRGKGRRGDEDKDEDGRDERDQSKESRGRAKDERDKSKDKRGDKKDDRKGVTKGSDEDSDRSGDERGSSKDQRGKGSDKYDEKKGGKGRDKYDETFKGKGRDYDADDEKSRGGKHTARDKRTDKKYDMKGSDEGSGDSEDERDTSKDRGGKGSDKYDEKKKGKGGEYDAEDNKKGKGRDKYDEKKGGKGREYDAEDNKKGKGSDKYDEKKGGKGREYDAEDDKKGKGSDKYDEKKGEKGREYDAEDDKKGKGRDKYDEKSKGKGREYDAEDDKREKGRDKYDDLSKGKGGDHDDLEDEKMRSGKQTAGDKPADKKNIKKGLDKESDRPVDDRDTEKDLQGKESDKYDEKKGEKKEKYDDKSKTKGRDMRDEKSGDKGQKLEHEDKKKQDVKETAKDISSDKRPDKKGKAEETGPKEGQQDQKGSSDKKEKANQFTDTGTSTGDGVGILPVGADASKKEDEKETHVDANVGIQEIEKVKEEPVCYKDFRVALDSLNKDIMKNLGIIDNNIKKNNAVANVTVKNIEPTVLNGLEEANGIDLIENDVIDYSRKSNAIDKYLSAEIGQYQDMLAQMEHELEIGLENLADALANSGTDPGAVADMSGKLTHLENEFEYASSGQYELENSQEALFAMLREKMQLIEMLNEVKVDRDMVEKAFETKVGIEVLNLYVDDMEFSAVLSDFQKKIHFSYEKFNNQEHLWQRGFDDVIKTINEKADYSSLMALDEDIIKNLNMLKSRLQAIRDIVGDVRGQFTNKKMIRDNNCLSCGTPAHVSNKRPDESQDESLELPKITTKRPPVEGAEDPVKFEENKKDSLCYPGLPVLHTVDSRAQYCQRYCGAKVKPPRIPPELKTEKLMKASDQKAKEKFPCIPCNKPKKKKGSVPINKNYNVYKASIDSDFPADFRRLNVKNRDSYSLRSTINNESGKLESDVIFDFYNTSL